MRPTSGSAPEPSPWVRSRLMLILTGASDICICCWSVLTAMNSTPLTPASIIRFSALQPPPPTPTTRMTARYGLDAPRGGESIPECGRSTTVELLPSSASTASASSAPALAASVALKSWASGPSRMLWRFAIAQHLPRQIAICLGGVALGIVLEHRGSLHGRLGIADRLADPGVEDQAAEILLQDLDRLPGMQRPSVEHGRQDALDAHVRVQVFADHRQGVLELDQPAQ